MVQRQFSTKMKSVYSDWGGEFRLFTKFLTELGIIRRLICPHTHHQNGLVEQNIVILLKQAFLFLPMLASPSNFGTMHLSLLPSSSIGFPHPQYTCSPHTLFSSTNNLTTSFSKSLVALAFLFFAPISPINSPIGLKNVCF